jgi:ribosomal-protein-alanine N-acetyltransferase
VDLKFIKITSAVTDDLDEMLQIENHSFPIPWSRKLFLKELENGLSYVYTAKDTANDKLYGYICFSIISEEMHILNLAVDESYRREKIATRLLLHGMEIAKGKGAKAAYLEVRVSHKTAKGLYQKMGFIEIAKRKKYYSDNDEDAIIMIKYI